MEQIKVSVIVPIYRVENFIERNAVSLFEQTLKDGIEFIFIDDCSPDNSIEILKKVLEKYPERKEQVKILKNTNNRGSGATRLKGLVEAKGEYIIQVDSDDWVDPDMYEKMLAKALEEKADIVACDFKEHLPDQILIRTNEYKSDAKEDILFDLFSNKIHSYMWNKIVKRDLYFKLSPIYVEGLNFWEDVSVVPRLFNEAKKISFLKEPLYHYNRENFSSYTRKQKDYSEEILQSLQINHAYFKDKNINDMPLMVRGAHLIMLYCKKSLRNKYRKEIKQLLPSKIDYTVLQTPYRKMLAWSLFNRLYPLSDLLIFTKKKLRKYY